MGVTTGDGVAFLYAQGEIDLANAEQLRALGEELVCSFIGTIRVDLSGVTFLDSTGLGALIGIRNAAEAARRILILDRPSPQALRILQITGLTDLFTIQP
jgi:anti-sigma B factor antagonist